jgi:predicted phosphodiesterase
MQRADIIRDYVRKWPDHPNLTIAKALYKKHPTFWTSVESVRTYVRRIRGAHGKASLRDESLHRPKGYAGQPPLELPKSVAEPWEPFVLETRKNLVLSDIHIPYHDDDALRLAIEDGRKFSPDCIVINGDCGDYFAVSHWEKDPRKRNLRVEIEQTRQFFAYLRKTFKKARIIWKHGNHEEWWLMYLWRKAPELLDVPHFDYPAIYELDMHGVELVQDKRMILAGKLPILHGHEFPKGMTNPVNQARGMFLRGVECSLTGHGHRTSLHSEPTMLGHVITCWSTGCLCDMHPRFSVINKWDQSFARVENDKAGAFEVTLRRIINGKVW